MNLNKKSRQSGFTLIELLAVVAILGILAGIAIPRVLGAIENARLNTDRANIAMLQSAVERWAMDVNPSGTLGSETTGWNALLDVEPGSAGPSLVASWDPLIPNYLNVIPTSPTTGVTYRLDIVLVAGQTVGTGRHTATVVRHPAP